MNNITHSSTSLVHIVAALIALIAGTYVLLSPKGTSRHRFIGWLYSGSMIVLLFTAFQMYYLFGRFGIVHWSALGSVVALAIGLGAVSLRARIRSWLQWHYLGMGVSITGVYASFLVESTYRFFPPVYFWWVTLGPTALVFIVSGLILRHYYPTWIKQTSSSPEPSVLQIF